jgi:excinuclease ABC, A subunit
MKFALIFLLFFVSIFGSNLSTYNIYERSDRIDIMLSFDAPYNGNIFQKRENGMILLVFDGLSFDQVVDKNINSKIIQEIFIEPKQNSVILSIKSSSAILVNASKTTDGFGLRVRITPPPTATSQNAEQPSQTVINRKESQSASDFVDARYYIVLGVLLGLLIVLWIVKRSLAKKTGVSKRENFSKSGAGLASWLSGGKTIKNGTEIIFEKPLDNLNRVILLQYQNRKYLVLTGSSNVLLDKFGEEKIQNEEDFQAFFEDNKKKLENYLQERQTSLSSYKDKMSVN